MRSMPLCWQLEFRLGLQEWNQFLRQHYIAGDLESALHEGHLWIELAQCELHEVVLGQCQRGVGRHAFRATLVQLGRLQINRWKRGSGRISISFMVKWPAVTLRTPTFNDLSVLCEIEQEHRIDFLRHVFALLNAIVNFAENGIALKLSAGSRCGWCRFLHLLQINVSTGDHLNASLDDARPEMDARLTLPHLDFERLSGNGRLRETHFDGLEKWRIVVGVSLQDGTHREAQSAQSMHDRLLMATDFRKVWIDVQRIQITRQSVNEPTSNLNSIGCGQSIKSSPVQRGLVEARREFDLSVGWPGWHGNW